MNHTQEVDFGTREKHLGTYLVGFLICGIITLLQFWVVMSSSYASFTKLIVVYGGAILQLLVQIIAFLGLNIKTPQGQMNIMSFIFTIVILVTIIAGSLWIMHNLNYYMMH